MSNYTKNNIPPDLIKAAELISQDKLKKAEPILRNYLNDDPLDVNAMKLLADIGVKFRAYKDAGYLLTRALDLAPDYDEARLSYANLLYKRQLPFEALKEIDSQRETIAKLGEQALKKGEGPAAIQIASQASCLCHLVDIFQSPQEGFDAAIKILKSGVCYEKLMQLVEAFNS